jgi:phosphate-selective porin OprO/OprP
MDCRLSARWGRSILRWVAAGSLMLAMPGQSVFAQEVGPSSESEAVADPFEDLLRRVEQLERDNAALRGEIHDEAAQRLDAISKLQAEEETETNAPVSPSGQAFLDPTDAAQQSDISAIQKQLKAIQDKASKKTYPSITVNGVFQADAGFFSQEAGSFAEFGRIQDGADFRRARLSAKGSVTEHTNYFMQMDFAFFGRPTFTDLWVEQTDVPLFGNVRIGQWKQPFSLEVVSSFRYTTFMERSLVFQPFTPFRHIGIGFYDHADDLSTTWAASVFRSGQDQFGSSLSTSGGWGTAERLTWCPVWECEGKEYLHLGAGHYFNAPPNGVTNFRTIPELFIGQAVQDSTGTSGQPGPSGAHDGTPFFAQTGNLLVNHFNVLGTELLWVEGPLSVQTEGMLNFVNQAGGPTAVLPGGYVTLGYFLTGEHRPYDRKTGSIDRVIPHRNLAFCGNCCNAGWGAWEIAARASYINLNNDINPVSATVGAGGEVTDLTGGVNWYWNPYTKVVFNYIHSVAHTTPATHPTTAAFGDTTTDMFAMRMQVDF